MRCSAQKALTTGNTCDSSFRNNKSPFQEKCVQVKSSSKKPSMVDLHKISYIYFKNTENKFFISVKNILSHQIIKYSGLNLYL